MEAPAGPTPRNTKQRDYGVVALLFGAVYLVSLFRPRFGFGRTVSGWGFAGQSGIAALPVVFGETLRVTRTWATRGSELLGFSMAAATGVLALGILANLRWGGEFGDIRFSAFKYGAWMSLAFAVLLLVVAVLRPAALRRSAP